MKAILVIDMPKSCYDCQYCRFDARRYNFRGCALTDTEVQDGTIDICKEVHRCCPLKPMPEKRELHQYVGDRCYHCRFFNGEKSSVGIACTNPMKEWRTRTAKYKQPSMKACKMFERKQGE